MKLSDPQIEMVVKQTGTTVLPQNKAAVRELVDHFGEHTFFIDHDGLLVWERVEDDSKETSKLAGVRVAIWDDREKKTVVGIEPTPTGVIVDSSVS